MGDTRQDGSNRQYDELQISIHLMEYDKLRDELLSAVGNLQQSVVLGLASISVAIPLLLSQAAKIPASITAGALCALSIVLSGMAMNFVSSTYAVAQVSYYIHTHIEPELNRLAQAVPEHKVLQWESFARSERRGFLALFLSVIGPGGVMLLLFLPSAVSLATAYYVLSTPAAQATQQDVASEIAQSWLCLLFGLAWFIYIAALVSLVLVTVYWILRKAITRRRASAPQ